MQFGDKLRWLIEEHDLTQRQLSAELNIPASTLANYVNHQSQPDFDMLKRFAAHFNVSIDYLLNYHPKQGANNIENELLHAFRSLPPDRQRILLNIANIL